MEGTMKRKVTKITHYDVQPTTKIQKVDNATSTDLNCITEKMQKLRISYRYEYYYDDERPMKTATNGDITVNNNNSYSAPIEFDLGNYTKFEQPTWRSRSDSESSHVSADCDVSDCDSLDSTLSATENGDTSDSDDDDDASDSDGDDDDASDSDGDTTDSDDDGDSTDNSWILTDISDENDNIFKFKFQKLKITN